MSLMDIPNDEQPSVIDVNQISSDLEADLDEQSAKDDEINLLSDKEAACTNNFSSYTNLAIHKQRYRELVHAIRRLNSKLESERSKYKNHEQELKKQIAALKDGKDSNGRYRNSSSISLVNVASEGEIAGKHNSHRQSSKLRDLEKLMAKCKESLKAKNQQLKILKDSLLEVDQFKDYIDGVKNELKDLRQTHETWTLSIAEGKRVMHLEIEDKNHEIDKLKAEIKDFQAQLKDSNNKSNQLKSNIQTLESRLVSTSAAHQKERESLTKELVAAKNNAIKQLQKDHGLQLERAKLDLERSIENLKLELLVKDEQIIRNAEREREHQEQVRCLKNDLECTKNQLSDAIDEQTKLRSVSEDQVRKLTELRQQIDDVKTDRKEAEIEPVCEDTAGLKARNDELEAKNRDLIQQLEDLTKKLASVEETNTELAQTLKHSKQSQSEEVSACDKCTQLQAQISKEAERYEQSSFELKTKLDLMTTANSDQEKVLHDLKSEREKSIEVYRSLKLEFDELAKKNETLSQVIQENEAELQSQQDQIKQLSAIKQQLEASRRENLGLNSKLAQVNGELNDRLDDIKKSQHVIDDLKKRLTVVEQETRSITQSSETLKKEKDSLATDLATESRRRRDLEQQLVVSILAAMKNLDTPDTSPGSDKTYKSDVPDSSDTNQERNLPDPLRLAEELSSLALDRSNAYMTSNQRLQAVLLDNTMINEEIKRLKEELNALNKEKTNEVLVSLEEVDRLRTENQALIHDQKAYDDQLASLEKEIEQLKNQIAEAAQIQPSKIDAGTTTDDDLLTQLVEKEQEIDRLRQVIVEKELAEKDQVEREQAEREQARMEQTEREQHLKEQIERERAQRDKMLKEQAIKEQAMKEQILKEHSDKEQYLKEQLEREKALRDEIQREQALKDHAMKEQADRERALKAQLEKERIQTDLILKEQALREQALEEQADREQALKDQLEREKAHRDQILEEQVLKEQAMKEQADREQALKEQLERERVQRDQILKEQAEREQSDISKAPKDFDEDIPDPTEFKYLKNIVYQFMMGREPTTLARVISAVFKFEQEQVEQICRVQEAIHQVSG